MINPEVNSLRPCIVRDEWARTAALSLLKKYQISHPPVQVENIIRQEGVRIEHHDLEDVDYPVSFCQGEKYVISIPITGDNDWDRFFLAREFGNIILGHYRTYKIDTLEKDVLRDSERAILENEAVLFAEELLLPSKWIGRYISLPLDMAQARKLKSVFGVPWSLVYSKLKRMGLIKPEALCPSATHG
ncbi:MAG: ImmA/IrrE family metallo-endopeptidase [Syntrophomonadaceae bacterium]|jgi:Zn-dependent peptidase ImmA (M78 family)|nr:ImmA/IrrE family metallo-endopeptidase [Syntrophomonadaceae bacterium]